MITPVIRKPNITGENRFVALGFPHIWIDNFVACESIEHAHSVQQLNDSTVFSAELGTYVPSAT